MRRPRERLRAGPEAAVRMAGAVVHLVPPGRQAGGQRRHRAVLRQVGEPLLHSDRPPGTSLGQRHRDPDRPADLVVSRHGQYAIREAAAMHPAGRDVHPDQLTGPGIEPG